MQQALGRGNELSGDAAEPDLEKLLSDHPSQLQELEPVTLPLVKAE